MTTTSCPSCGTQLPDANIRFCSSCGSQVARPNLEGNVSHATSDVNVVKAKLKPPAIAIMVSVGIGLVQSLYGLMLPDYTFSGTDAGLIAAGKTLWILAFPMYGFSIYGALQMMKARQHGFALTSAIITILSGCQNLIGFPIGIWALVVLQKPEIKTVFGGRLRSSN